MFDEIRSVFTEISVPHEVDSYYKKYFNEWRKIYEDNPDWKVTKLNSPAMNGKRVTSTFGGAKVICDSFVSLITAENCNINIDNKKYAEYINNVLYDNDYFDKLSDFLARAFAFGGGVMKCYISDNKPRIGFINADKFFPTAWSNDVITEGVFVSVSRSNNSIYKLYEWHRLGRISYRLYRSDHEFDKGRQCELSEMYPYLPPEILYPNCDVSMFSYFKPSATNNLLYDVPLGISIFHNSIGTLKTLDTVFDSFYREFILGKKRIIVPAEALQPETDRMTGDRRYYFDVNDEVFVGLGSDEMRDVKIVDNTMTLRIDEHIYAMNALLSTLCMQTGLSSGTLSFNTSSGVKTATEIIAESERTMMTITANRNRLGDAICRLVDGLIVIGRTLGILDYDDYLVDVAWHDKTVIDDSKLIENNIALVAAGLRSQVKAIMEINKCSLEEAMEEMKNIVR